MKTPHNEAILQELTKLPAIGPLGEPPAVRVVKALDRIETIGKMMLKAGSLEITACGILDHVREAREALKST